jgi:hypothetical protein
MNYPGAIVIAASLIAAALLLTGQGHSQTARYAVAHDAAAGAIWRIDTMSGSLARCLTDQKDQVKCSQPVAP